jgi:hypothetical protein
MSSPIIGAEPSTAFLQTAVAIGVRQADRLCDGLTYRAGADIWILFSFI